MVRIEVKPSGFKPGVKSVWIEVEGVSKADLKKIRVFLKKKIETEKQVSNAFADSFIFAAQTCPKANPSDLWQHIIYRSILDFGFSDQQWKRISGFALERAFVEFYQMRLEKYDFRIRCLPKGEAHELFTSLGFKGEIKKDKIDCIVERKKSDKWLLFAGLHIKSSLAERIQDDVPASLALMSKGILSVVLTLDSKSFPPPHGDGVNHGELGGRNWIGGEDESAKTRIKRQYIEIDGQFDALFSYNLRTPPSPENTPSGKRIYTLGLHESQPDAFVAFLLNKSAQ